jgi:hypothetical protein
LNIIDECAEFLSDHVAAAEEQIDAMTLAAIASHATRYMATVPRILFTSDEPESGKTHAMETTVSLASNPMNLSGTSYAWRSGLMEVSNTPEAPPVTLFLDEVSDVFGPSGLKGQNNPISEVMRKGYKRKATLSQSVNRVKVEYSIFAPVFMTGLRAAVPRDIRTRCIVISMRAGKPRKYFDVRETEPYAESLQHAIAGAVRAHRSEIERFRARGLHPKLTNRKLEIWESLFAVAYALGGNRWLSRALRAFSALALDESEQVPLTPRQIVTRDVAAAAEQLDGPYVTSGQLTDELSRLDEKLYDSRTEHSLACLIRDSVAVKSGRVTVNGQQVRAYRRDDLLAAWEAIRPKELTDDADMPEESDDLSDCEDWD